MDKVIDTIRCVGINLTIALVVASAFAGIIIASL